MNFNIEFPKDKEIEVLGQKVIVRQQVPLSEKLAAIQTILSLSLEQELGIYAPAKVMVYKYLYFFYLYTDIEFSDVEKDAPMELYDQLRQIDTVERPLDYLDFISLLEEHITKYETYQTSAYGILDSLKKDYNNLDFDIEKLQKDLTNKKNIELVDEIVHKLG